MPNLPGMVALRYFLTTLYTHECVCVRERFKVVLYKFFLFYTHEHVYEERHIWSIVEVVSIYHRSISIEAWHARHATTKYY